MLQVKLRKKNYANFQNCPQMNFYTTILRKIFSTGVFYAYRKEAEEKLKLRSNKTSNKFLYLFIKPYKRAFKTFLSSKNDLFRPLHRLIRNLTTRDGLDRWETGNS